MLHSYLTELALRKAIMDVEVADKPLSQLEACALKHAGVLVKTKLDSSLEHGEMGLQATAVTQAIRGLQGAWLAMKEQLKALGLKRIDFDKEHIHGIATFLCPSNKESRDLSKEQMAMLSFKNLIERNPHLKHYLGLKSDVVKSDEFHIHGQLLSVLPFYKMSEHLQLNDSSRLSGLEIRRSISLFFKTQVPKFLNKIKSLFYANSKVSDFFVSKWQGENYLNNYRGPRVVMMCLANLLWHLQHPVDPNTGMMLGLDEKIALCREVLVFINILLDKNKQPKMSSFAGDAELENYIRQIEIYVEELKKGFELEKLRAVNISDVASRAHRAARIVDENIFKLVYNKHNMAGLLASTVGYLNMLQNRDLSLSKIFDNYDVKLSLINRPIKTVVDIMLVYFNLPLHKKQQLLQTILNKETKTAECFALTLQSLDETFLQPILQSCQKSVDAGGMSLNGKDIQHLATARLMPLMSLALMDYQVQLESELVSKTKSHTALPPTYKTSQRQLNDIASMAFANDMVTRTMFSWDLSTYVKIDSIYTDKINLLPKKQFKIGQLTKLLDLLSNFISNYRTLLTNANFKQFIVDSLDAIEREFKSLGSLINELEQDINADTSEDRHLIDTVKTLDNSLQLEISRFRNLVNSLEERINHPMFAERIRKEVIIKLKQLEAQFHLAFGHRNIGLSSFLEDLAEEFENDSREREKPIRYVSSGHVAKLSALVMACYHSLSESSKADKKGKLLLDIEARLSRQEHLTDIDLQKTLKELTRIVCAYRPGLFQSTYANTRSADVLVSAIAASLTDSSFPLAEWLFGPDCLLEFLQADNPRVDIIGELNALRKNQYWAYSSDYLAPVSVLS